MKKAIICHGVSRSFDDAKSKDLPGSARSWLGWLQQKYIISGVSCQNPSFPNSWRPVRNYKDDVNVFSRLEIDSDTRLVGHSCGAGFLLKYLSEHPEIKVRHLVLVAPWLDPSEELGDYFKGFESDKNLPSRIKKMELIFSSDDMGWVINSVEKIIKTYPQIMVHKFDNRGHFNGIPNFPELWEICQAQI